MLSVYPQGSGTPRGKYFSFYLKLCDGGNLAPGQKLYVEYKLGMKNQLTNVYYEKEGKFKSFNYHKTNINNF